MSDQYQLGDQPIEHEFSRVMNAFAKALDQLLNGGVENKDRKVGFCLMVFPFDSFDGRANYISNAKRDDVIVLLREQLARFEGRMSTTEGHG